VLRPNEKAAAGGERAARAIVRLLFYLAGRNDGRPPPLPDSGSGPGMVVIQEIFGVNGYIKGACERLAKLGYTYVIVGHSERRTYHREDDALVAAKAAAAFRHGLIPIVCIGEHLEVREAGEHVAHCVNQLRGSLADLTAEQVGNVVIAYEPVWAIGTGRVASAADAQEVCQAIRKELGALSSPTAADAVRVLYGGSVNAKNIGEIVAQDDVDGALVGGVSLDGEQFASMSAIAAGGPLP